MMFDANPAPSLIANKVAEKAAEVISVSTLNRLARETLERGFPLFWIAGEVSNLTRASSGHLYFSLKDESAQVRCVMFRNRAQLVPFRLQEGMRIEARALVTLYEARGDFQLNVEGLRLAGIGALYEAFARLRVKLEQEGLFSAENKRALPRFPRRIGIVTSLQAAALQDVLAALARRSPHIHVMIYPVPVQGEMAGGLIASALQTAAKRNECDVLIVTRGGGSIEDLWAFNEEAVARAIAACPIPIIAGIGHETDTTIADLVADQRAATPTAAAELATAGYFDAQQRLDSLEVALLDAMRRTIEARTQQIDLLARSLLHPGERLARLSSVVAHLQTRLTSSVQLHLNRNTNALYNIRSRFNYAKPNLSVAARDMAQLTQRFKTAMSAQLNGRSVMLDALATNLAHLNPSAVLHRGYSITRTAQGEIVQTSDQVEANANLHITFAEGWVIANVKEKGS